MAKKIEMIGKKFGRLTVIQLSKIGIDRESHWECVCECGEKTIVRGYHLRSGRVKSCGCLMREVARMPRGYSTRGNTKHGGSNTRLYEIWSNMKTRCFNPKNRAFKWYGAIGITICADWLKFENFQKWAMQSGYKDNLTIERINPCGDYEPSNCTWIPKSEQRKNQRRSKQWRNSN